MEPAPKSPVTQPRGFGSELKNLHQNGSASASELREFLSKLRGRSPQEVVGIVSSSLLVQSMVQAVLLTMFFTAVFTVGPYLVWGPNTRKKAEVAATPATAAPSATAPTATTPASGDAATPSTTVPSADPAAAAKVLGIDETKEAPADKNPLDGSLDKLIDGLD
jgi:hypothetical protein